MVREHRLRGIFMAALLLLVLSVGSAAGMEESGLSPKSFLDEVERYPDLTQTDVRAGFPLGGWFHCGPVAASNGLIWLRERGIGIGPSPSGDRFADQVEMARRLGSGHYMDTRFASRGTLVAGFLEGLEGYLRDHSSESFSIRYMGWATHPGRFSTGLRSPDLTWLCRAFAAGSAVFLDLGWYRFRKDRGVFRRNGGHWVTLVGYSWPDEEEVPRLYVHDPAPWSGKSRQTHLVSLAPAGEEIFTTRSGARIGSLGPYLRITEGLVFKRGTELALLEGAVILSPEVEPAVPWIAGSARVRKEFFPYLGRSRGDGR